MPAKRYKVTLTHEERQDLLALISKGKNGRSQTHAGPDSSPSGSRSTRARLVR